MTSLFQATTARPCKVSLIPMPTSFLSRIMLSFFLGVEVTPHPWGLLLSQQRYISNLLSCTNMTEAKPVLTPLVTTTNTCSSHQHGPYQSQLIPNHRRESPIFLSYASWCCFCGQQIVSVYAPSHQWSLESCKMHTMLHVFSDVDCTGNNDDYTSTNAYIVYLGQDPIYLEF